MTDYHRTALILEEQAAKLSRDNLRQDYLLQLAKAARLIAFEMETDDFEIERRIGSHRKRAATWADMPGQEHRAMRAAIHVALQGLEMPSIKKAAP